MTAPIHTQGEAPPPTEGEPAVEVRGLSAGYGRTTVLRDVSLTVPQGQVTALVGPNGAGKTTLLRTISGFVRPTSGSVRLFGTDMTRTPAYRRFAAGLCHVPEGRGVFRSLSVRDNLLLQAPRGAEKEVIDRACDTFPALAARLRQSAGTLSGGEQQMLAMAAAYARNPALILVDEASLGLAPLVVDQIFAFLARVAADGSALLIVDQFADRALAMATTAYVLSRGAVTYAGAAAALDQAALVGHYLGG